MVINKIKNLRAEKEQLSGRFYREIPAEPELKQMVEKHIETAGETTYKDTKRRHLQKLQNLTNKTATKAINSPEQALDLSGTQLKMGCQLVEIQAQLPETNVLTKGLNYAISPADICAEKFILATELACKHLPKADGRCSTSIENSQCVEISESTRAKCHKRREAG